MKSSLEELAIFGGLPAFQEKLHVGRPNIGNRERLLKRINQVLDNKWLTNAGPFEQEFEERIAKLVGVRHCVSICNGTVALEIAIRASGLKGEVIIPSFTFIATAHALQWQEIIPVFCDIDPQTHTLDPAKVEQMITPRTSGIIGVHLWGQSCDVKALTDVARRHGVKLLFDAAHAFGCSYEGRLIGNFGDAEVFSFHATKFFNTFEGGAVVTNDDALAAAVRLMRNFGFAGYDEVIKVGTNGKMSEISAVMGLTGLESLEEFIAINYRNYKCYQRELADLPGIRLFLHNEVERGNYQYITLEIDESVTRLSRDRLMHVLWAENILARRYFYPGCHRMEPYRSHYTHAAQSLPETEKVAESVLCLPTGMSVTPIDIAVIGRIIRTALHGAEAVNRRLENGPTRP
jgi:dTDP-4-amino-4,6-dideoxygalactose transaminase